MNLSNYFPADIINHIASFITVDAEVKTHFENEVRDHLTKKEVAIESSNGSPCVMCFVQAIRENYQMELCDEHCESGETIETVLVSTNEFGAVLRDEISQSGENWDPQTLRQAKLAFCGSQVMRRAWENVSYELWNDHAKTEMVRELEWWVAETSRSAVSRRVLRVAVMPEDIDVELPNIARLLRNSDIVVDKVKYYIDKIMGYAISVLEH